MATEEFTGVDFTTTPFPKSQGGTGYILTDCVIPFLFFKKVKQSECRSCIIDMTDACFVTGAKDHVFESCIFINGDTPALAGIDRTSASQFKIYNSWIDFSSMAVLFGCAALFMRHCTIYASPTSLPFSDDGRLYMFDCTFEGTVPLVLVSPTDSGLIHMERCTGLKLSHIYPMTGTSVTVLDSDVEFDVTLSFIKHVNFRRCTFTWSGVTDIVTNTEWVGQLSVSHCNGFELWHLEYFRPERFQMFESPLNLETVPFIGCRSMHFSKCTFINRPKSYDNNMTHSPAEVNLQDCNLFSSQFSVFSHFERIYLRSSVLKFDRVFMGGSALNVHETVFHGMIPPRPERYFAFREIHMTSCRQISAFPECTHLFVRKCSALIFSVKRPFPPLVNVISLQTDNLFHLPDLKKRFNGIQEITVDDRHNEFQPNDLEYLLAYPIVILQAMTLRACDYKSMGWSKALILYECSIVTDALCVFERFKQVTLHKCEFIKGINPIQWTGCIRLTIDDPRFGDRIEADDVTRICIQPAVRYLRLFVEYDRGLNLGQSLATAIEQTSNVVGFEMAVKNISEFSITRVRKYAVLYGPFKALTESNIAYVKGSDRPIYTFQITPGRDPASDKLVIERLIDMVHQSHYVYFDFMINPALTNEIAELARELRKSGKPCVVEVSPCAEREALNQLVRHLGCAWNVCIIGPHPIHSTAVQFRHRHVVCKMAHKTLLQMDEFPDAIATHICNFL